MSKHTPTPTPQNTTTKSSFFARHSGLPHTRKCCATGRRSVLHCNLQSCPRRWKISLSERRDLISGLQKSFDPSSHVSCHQIKHYTSSGISDLDTGADHYERSEIPADGADMHSQGVCSMLSSLKKAFVNYWLTEEKEFQESQLQKFTSSITGATEALTETINKTVERTAINRVISSTSATAAIVTHVLKKLKPANTVDLLLQIWYTKDWKQTSGTIIRLLELHGFLYETLNQSQVESCLEVLEGFKLLSGFTRHKDEDKGEMNSQAFIVDDPVKHLKFARFFRNFGVKGVEPSIFVSILAAVLALFGLMGGTFVGLTNGWVLKHLKNLRVCIDSFAALGRTKALFEKAWVFIQETIGGLFGLKHMNETDKQALEIRSQLDEAQREGEQLALLLNVNPGLLYENKESFQKLTHTLDVISAALRRVGKIDKNMTNLRVQCDMLKEAYKQISDKREIFLRSVLPRLEMTCIAFVGDTSVGKSKLVEPFVKDVMEDLGLSTAVYYKNNGDQYESLYSQQPTILIDDFNQNKENKDHEYVFRLITPSDVGANMAALNDKGMKVKSNLLILTSNQEHVLTSSTISTLDALNRRREFVIRVENPRVKSWLAYTKGTSPKRDSKFPSNHEEYPNMRVYEREAYTYTRIPSVPAMLIADKRMIDHEYMASGSKILSYQDIVHGVQDSLRSNMEEHKKKTKLALSNAGPNAKEIADLLQRFANMKSDPTHYVTQEEYSQEEPDFEKPDFFDEEYENDKPMRELRNRRGLLEQILDEEDETFYEDTPKQQEYYNRRRYPKRYNNHAATNTTLPVAFSKYLQNTEKKIVALSGPPGVGKSHIFLSLEASYLQRGLHVTRWNSFHGAPKVPDTQVLIIDDLSRCNKEEMDDFFFFVMEWHAGIILPSYNHIPSVLLFGYNPYILSNTVDWDAEKYTAFVRRCETIGFSYRTPWFGPQFNHTDVTAAVKQGQTVTKFIQIHSLEGNHVTNMRRVCELQYDQTVKELSDISLQSPKKVFYFDVPRIGTLCNYTATITTKCTWQETGATFAAVAEQRSNPARQVFMLSKAFDKVSGVGSILHFLLDANSASSPSVAPKEADDLFIGLLNSQMMAHHNYRIRVVTSNGVFVISGSKGCRILGLLEIPDTIIPVTEGILQKNGTLVKCDKADLDFYRNAMELVRDQIGYPSLTTIDEINTRESGRKVLTSCATLSEAMMEHQYALAKQSKECLEIITMLQTVGQIVAVAFSVVESFHRHTSPSPPQFDNEMYKETKNRHQQKRVKVLKKESLENESPTREFIEKFDAKMKKSGRKWRDATHYDDMLDDAWQDYGRGIDLDQHFGFESASNVGLYPCKEHIATPYKVRNVVYPSFYSAMKVIAEEPDRKEQHALLTMLLPQARKVCEKCMHVHEQIAFVPNTIRAVAYSVNAKLNGFSNRTIKLRRPSTPTGKPSKAEMEEIAHLLPDQPINRDVCLKSESCVDPQFLTISSHIVDNNLVEIQTEYGIKAVNAVMLRGTIGVMNFHATILCPKLYACRGDKKWEVQIIKSIPFRDIAFFRLLDCPNFKDITKHLLTREEFFSEINNQRGVVCIPRNLTTDRPHTNSLNVIFDTRDIVSINRDKARDIVTWETTFDGIRAKTNLTTEGDCGSPTFILNPMCQRKFVGIHSAGNNISGGVAYIFAEDVGLESQSTGGFAQPYKYQSVKLYDSVQPFLDTENVHIIGDLDFKSYIPNQTNFQRSPLFLEVNGPPVMEPAALSSHDRRLPEDKKDVLENAIRRYDTKHHEINDDSLEWATEFVSEWFSGIIKSNNCFMGVLGKTEAINSPSYVEQGTSVNTKASPGYPFKHLVPSGKGKFAYIYTAPSGKKTIKDTEDGKLLNFAVDRLISDAKQGKRTPVIFQSGLKNETLEREKIRVKGKTRLFMSTPLDLYISMRMYTHTAIAAMHACHKELPGQIGLDITSPGYSEMVHSLLNISDTGFEADFSSWDSTVPIEFMRAVPKVLNSIYRVCDPFWVVQHDIIRTNLYEHLCAPLITYNDKVLSLPKGQPSGEPNTAGTNCIVNTLLHMYIYKELARKNGINREVLTQKYVHENLKFINMGDDTNDATHPNIMGWYNGESFMEECALIGMKATSVGVKGEGVEKHKKVIDMCFMAMTPSPIKLGNLFMPSLRDVSLQGMMCWYHKPGKKVYPDMALLDGPENMDLVVLQQVVESAAIFTAMKGQQEYASFRLHVHATNFRYKCDLKVPKYGDVLQQHHFAPVAGGADARIPTIHELTSLYRPKYAKLAEFLDSTDNELERSEENIKKAKLCLYLLRNRVLMIPDPQVSLLQGLIRLPHQTSSM